MLLSSSFPFLIFNICSFSGGHELENLILNDLFYHIQGELNGRQIDNRPFKELLQFLIDAAFLDAYKYEKDDDISSNIKAVCLYDTVRLRTDLGLEMWDLLAWKEATEVVEKMLLFLQETNSGTLLLTSKHSALRGLVTLLYMRENNVSFISFGHHVLRVLPRTMAILCVVLIPGIHFSIVFNVLIYEIYWFIYYSEALTSDTYKVLTSPHLVRFSYSSSL